MESEFIKKRLIEISDMFYRESYKEGLDAVLQIAVELGSHPVLMDKAGSLFDALEQNDYLLGADILYHEMAKKL